MNFFQQLFSPDFMPHGYCYMWVPRIVWLHVISDGLIAVAYYVSALPGTTFKTTTCLRFAFAHFKAGESLIVRRKAPSFAGNSGYRSSF
jgi:hypothetical protein